MITLSNSSGVLTFTSDTFSQPLNAGCSSTYYLINHNLGVIPDLVKLHATGDHAAPYRPIPDFYSIGGSCEGYDVFSLSATSVEIYVYRWASFDIYFKIYALGGTHHATL